MDDELIRRVARASCDRRCKLKGYCMMDDDSNSGLNGHCAARAQSCLSAAGVDELVKALEAARNHINNLSNSRAQSFTGNMLAQIDAALSLAKGEN